MIKTQQEINRFEPKHSNPIAPDNGVALIEENKVKETIRIEFQKFLHPKEYINVGLNIKTGEKYDYTNRRDDLREFVKRHPNEAKAVFEENVRETITKHIIDNIKSSPQSPEKIKELTKHVYNALSVFCSNPTQQKHLHQDTARLIKECAKEVGFIEAKGILAKIDGIKEFYSNIKTALFGEKEHFIDSKTIEAFKRYVKLADLTTS